MHLISLTDCYLSQKYFSKFTKMNAYKNWNSSQKCKSPRNLSSKTFILPVTLKYTAAQPALL